MLYFAYGSNLNKVEMKKRCKDSVSVKKVKLKGYELIFNEFADIIENSSEVVYGALYEVSDEDIKNLDRYEEYPELYEKIKVNVEDDEGKNYESFVYTMIKKDIKEPDTKYYNIIKQGFKDWELPLEILEQSQNKQQRINL